MSEGDILVLTDTTIAGAISGKADLDEGKVRSDQLPSYVDDVLEYQSSGSFPSSGEPGKLYLDANSNKLYRYSSSGYVVVEGSDHPVASVNGKTGTVVLDPSDIGAASSGSVVLAQGDAYDGWLVDPPTYSYMSGGERITVKVRIEYSTYGWYPYFTSTSGDRTQIGDNIGDQSSTELQWSSGVTAPVDFRAVRVPGNSYVLGSQSGSKLAGASGFSNHVLDQDRHVTATDRARWDGKQDVISYPAGILAGSPGGNLGTFSVPDGLLFGESSGNSVCGIGIPDGILVGKISDSGVTLGTAMAGSDYLAPVSGASCGHVAVLNGSGVVVDGGIGVSDLVTVSGGTVSGNLFLHAGVSTDSVKLSPSASYLTVQAYSGGSLTRIVPDGTRVASLLDIAPLFSESGQYSKGDAVVRSGSSGFSLFVCEEAHCGAWDGRHFSAATVQDAVASRPVQPHTHGSIDSGNKSVVFSGSDVAVETRTVAYGQASVTFSSGYSITYLADTYSAGSGETITFSGPVSGTDGHVYWVDTRLGSVDSYNPASTGRWSLFATSASLGRPEYLMYETGPGYSISGWDGEHPSLSLWNGTVQGTDVSGLSRTSSSSSSYDSVVTSSVLSQAVNNVVSGYESGISRLEQAISGIVVGEGGAFDLAEVEVEDGWWSYSPSTVTLFDRTINNVQLTSGSGSSKNVNMTFPDKVSGKAREFMMRVYVDDTFSSVTFNMPSSATVDFGSGFSEQLDMDGVSLVSFLEVREDTWKIDVVSAKASSIASQIDSKLAELATSGIEISGTTYRLVSTPADSDTLGSFVGLT